MHRDRKRVLLFEDDYESMHVLQEYLQEEMGWDVELSAAKSLLERLRHERFDLVVVDAMIHPRSLNANEDETENVRFEGISWQKSGPEFLRRLRQGQFTDQTGGGTSPDVPAIVLSAVASYSVESELGNGVAVEKFVEKPFRLSDLTALMRSLLQE